MQRVTGAGSRTQPAVEAGTASDRVRVRRLLGMLGPYLPRLVLALVALSITTLIGLAFPYVIQLLIDGVLRTGDLAQLNRIAVGLAALFLVRLGAAYFQQYQMAYIGERVVLDLREAIYQHLLTLSVSFFNERRSGEIVSRLISDAWMVRGVLTSNLATLITQALTLVGALVIVVALNWRLTLFILVLAPVMGILGALFGRLIRRISTEVQDELAASSTIIEEVVQSIRVVKSFVREPYESGRYSGALARTFDAAMRLTRVRAAFGPLATTAMFLAITAVLWFGGREVIAGRLTPGGLTSFLFYLVFIAGSFGSFTTLYTQVQEALGATRRIFEILDTEPEVQDAPGAHTLDRVEGRITFDGVSFTYDERAEVLDGVTLAVEPGEVLALVGPSGAGKSTLVSLIARFYDPTGGAIRLDGHDLRSVTQHSLRQQIALVPQETILFGGTIRENILYGRLEASEAELIEAARAANAHDFITALPDGYDTEVGERGVKLSGGQRQRIAIARALLKDPRILLLDEATSSLDSESEGLVQEALERLMQGRTTVIIAHRLSTVQIADRVAVLDGGRLAELGTPDALLAADGLYARLYRMQYEAGLRDLLDAGLGG